MTDTTTVEPTQEQLIDLAVDLGTDACAEIHDDIKPALTFIVGIIAAISATSMGGSEDEAIAFIDAVCKEFNLPPKEQILDATVAIDKALA